jgi:hypothetical protein
MIACSNSHMSPGRGPTAITFVDGQFCRPIKVAYDFTKGQVVDFETVAPILKAAIIRDYAFTAEELRDADADAFRWVTSPRFLQRAHDEFRRRRNGW